MLGKSAFTCSESCICMNAHVESAVRVLYIYAGSLCIECMFSDMPLYTEQKREERERQWRRRIR